MPTTYCRHIRATGRRCQSPAIRGRVFCFYHSNINDRQRTLHQGTCNIGEAEPFKLQFPTLEDPESIQMSLSLLVAALGDNRLEVGRARTILYGLRVAAQNIGNLEPLPNRDEGGVVSDVVLDEHGTLIASDQDPDEIISTNPRREEKYPQFEAEQDRYEAA